VEVDDVISEDMMVADDGGNDSFYSSTKTVTWVMLTSSIFLQYSADYNRSEVLVGEMYFWIAKHVELNAPRGDN